MNETIQQLLATKGIHTLERQGLHVAEVSSSDQGLELAKDVLYEIVDKKTLLLVSGGSTPKPLYSEIAKEEKLRPGVVGLTDERYGTPMHDQSNEKMIAESGLLRYLTMRDIIFYGLLRGLPIDKTASRYDELIRSLQTVYPKSVGLMGIGPDGHTAGIAPNRADFANPIFEDKDRTFPYVSYFNDQLGTFKERITLTFLGLSMMDVLIILVFGQSKSEAIKRMFGEEKEEIVPARFFLRKEIAPKTLLITDCKV